MFKLPVQLTEEVGKKLADWLSSSGVTPDEFAELLGEVLDAESMEQLNAVGQKIASKGLCDEDRAKIKEAYLRRKHEITEGKEE